MRVQDSERGKLCWAVVGAEVAALRGGPRTSRVVQTAPCRSPRARFRRRKRPEACSIRRLSSLRTVHQWIWTVKHL